MFDHTPGISLEHPFYRIGRNWVTGGGIDGAAPANPTFAAVGGSFAANSRANLNWPNYARYISLANRSQL
jgi:hypothetical protein